MDKTPMRHRLPLAILLAATALLGACQKQAGTPLENQQVETPKPIPPVAAPAPEKPKPAPLKVAKVKAKPAPKPSEDQQITDDADATGMTSHTSPDADTAGSPGNSQP